MSAPRKAASSVPPASGSMLTTQAQTLLMMAMTMTPTEHLDGSGTGSIHDCLVELAAIPLGRPVADQGVDPGEVPSHCAAQASLASH